jgi:cytochrome c oxidase subunit 2
MAEFSDTIAQKVDSAFLFIAVVSVILLIGITLFMIYSVIRFRKDKNRTASEVEGNLLLEIVWTVVPTVLVMAMFYYGWTGFKFIRKVPPDAMVVKVTARMWSWQFEYENGKKESVLRVPVGKPVKVLLKSDDVIHSFYVPAFRVKEDAVPGLETYLWFRADSPGEYDVFCAEYCGTGHSRMLSKVIALPEDEFREWYEGKEEGVAAVPHGRKLLEEKGCLGCHTTDGSSLVGPTFKNLYGRKERVFTSGKIREIIINSEYIKRAIKSPGEDVVEGYENMMPSYPDMTEHEIEEIVEYIETLK